MNILIYAILICILLFFVNKFLSLFKIPKVNCLSLTSGGVKCGKSTFTVNLVLKTYKKSLRTAKFKNFILRLFHKKQIELPLLYSNVPLACPYVELTKELLTRCDRFAYGSIVYIQEASLVADSQLIKDKILNNDLLLFFKLFGHETRGGHCFVDTQSCSDVHYSLKRSLSEYFYVHHLTKWIPFILIAHVTENRYSEDGSVVVAETKDVESNLKRVIFSKRVWKYFDAFCFSVLTDDKPVSNNVINNNLQTKDLKAYKIVSFRPEFNIEKERKNEKKDN